MATSLSAECRTQTLVMTFGVGGNLCYLSHHETVLMLQRALIRAGVHLRYSEGFNPRPRLSLPLPRAVGVRSDCEMLCAMVEAGEDTAESIRARLEGQLPEGCTIRELQLVDGKTSFQPVEATYRICVSDLAGDPAIREAIAKLRADLESRRPVEVQRSTGGVGPVRTLDVGAYLAAVEQDDDWVSCRCRITPQGTIRIEELLAVLRIEPARVAEPIRREAVQWERRG
jgi:radical SAM-linked protein